MCLLTSKKLEKKMLKKIQNHNRAPTHTGDEPKRLNPFIRLRRQKTIPQEDSLPLFSVGNKNLSPTKWLPLSHALIFLVHSLLVTLSHKRDTKKGGREEFLVFRLPSSCPRRRYFCHRPSHTHEKVERKRKTVKALNVDFSPAATTCVCDSMPHAVQEIEYPWFREKSKASNRGNPIYPPTLSS